jgi:phage gp16-like protein
MPGIAAPARFAPDPRRRALLAKVHLGKKELGLADDDYRAMLFRVTDRTSAAELDERQLVAVVEEMKAKGFQAKPAVRPAGADRRGRGRGGPRPADHPAARKARALWISLHQLGAIENPSEQALEAFARRQLGVERLQWADQARTFKLIEALKAIAERNGWSQELAGVRPAVSVKVLKLRLCEAILAKLKSKRLAAADWTLETAAARLLGEAPGGGPLFWGIGSLDVVAAGLGRKLRGEA